MFFLVDVWKWSTESIYFLQKTSYTTPDRWWLCKDKLYLNPSLVLNGMWSHAHPQRLITTVVYKNYIYIFNWKTKNKKKKTVFSKRNKSAVVIIWLTYLFVNIDTQISAFVYSGSEFQIWGPKVLKLLSPYLTVLWTYTSIYLVYMLAILFYEISLLWKQDLGHSESWKNSNHSVLGRFTSIVQLPWFIKKGFVIAIKVIIENSKCSCLNIFNFP